MRAVQLSIVTPCLNARRFVRHCVDSVRLACAGLEYEHVIVDGESADGTLEYLRAQTDVRLIVARDGGMYEALNRAVEAARGDVVGHLNTDEQYCRPGLQSALARLQKDAALDAVFGPTIMVNGRLEFLQLFNQIVTPRVADTHWCMPVQTCSLLYRRRVWTRFPYATRAGGAGDHVWFRRQMELGLRLEREPQPIGIFAWHGENLSSKAESKFDPLADIDRRSLRIRAAKHWYRFKKLLLGGYARRPLQYQICTDRGVETVAIARPALKLRRFDNTARS